MPPAARKAANAGCKLARSTWLDNLMGGAGAMDFVVGLLGAMACVGLENLTKALKVKGILDQDDKEE